MARKNKLGTPYLGLKLDKEEEAKLKKYLKGKEESAKKLQRKLLRDFLKTI